MKFLKEPLLHFLLIGGALFALDSRRTEAPAPAEENRVVISSKRIEHLANDFTETRRRPPTDEELAEQVEDFILEELYYREAMALGLHRDDDIVRRHLREKLETLTLDPAVPTDEELAAYLEENRADFMEQPRYRMHQIFINPTRHEDPLAHAQTGAARLRRGGEFEGDPTRMETSFERISPRGIDRQFGLGFAEKIKSLEAGRWSDPLESALGLHLILIEERISGGTPDLEEIRREVAAAWEEDRTRDARREFNQELHQRYEVIVQWPQPEDGP